MLKLFILVFQIGFFFQDFCLHLLVFCSHFLLAGFFDFEAVLHLYVISETNYSE